MTERKRPANQAGRSVVICFAGNDENSGHRGGKQGQWADARSFERLSHDHARQGLAMRGVDRLVALALASTYALAARDAVLMAGGAR